MFHKLLDVLYLLAIKPSYINCTLVFINSYICPIRIHMSTLCVLCGYICVPLMCNSNLPDSWLQYRPNICEYLNKHHEIGIFRMRWNWTWRSQKCLCELVMNSRWQFTAIHKSRKFSLSQLWDCSVLPYLILLDKRLELCEVSTFLKKKNAGIFRSCRPTKYLFPIWLFCYRFICE